MEEIVEVVQRVLQPRGSRALCKSWAWYGKERRSCPSRKLASPGVRVVAMTTVFFLQGVRDYAGLKRWRAWHHRHAAAIGWTAWSLLSTLIKSSTFRCGRSGRSSSRSETVLKSALPKHREGTPHVMNEILEETRDITQGRISERISVDYSFSQGWIFDKFCEWTRERFYVDELTSILPKCPWFSSHD